jgi:hypothetical protein
MSLAVVSCLALAAGLSFAEAPAGKPVPGPEHKKLGYFVGKWTMTGEMKPSPFMPGGTMSGTDVCDWFEGGFAVVCKTEGKGPMGPMKGLGIMGYSTEEKAYTYYGLDNGPMTMASVPRGTVQAGTWTYADESMMGGKKIKSRYVLKELSPTSYTFKWEMLGEDGTWQTLAEGKSTKAS